jgi:phosphocarrier protein
MFSMERLVTINNSAGLHARPAAMLVKMASLFPCEISLVKGGRKANAKSILSLMSLGLGAKSQVTVITSGEMEAEALEEIGEFLEKFED